VFSLFLQVTGRPSPARGRREEADLFPPVITVQNHTPLVTAARGQKRHQGHWTACHCSWVAFVFFFLFMCFIWTYWTLIIICEM
jgi:hypothetical protein